jgi:hypothetical protein
VAVDGAHPDAGRARDVVDLGVGALAGEHLARRGDDALAVAARVGPEGSFGVEGHGVGSRTCKRSGGSVSSQNRNQSSTYRLR